MVTEKRQAAVARFYGENAEVKQLTKDDLDKEQAKRTPRARLATGDVITFFDNDEEHFVGEKTEKFGDGKTTYKVQSIPCVLTHEDESGNLKESDILFYVSWLSNTGYSVLAYADVVNGDEKLAQKTCADRFKANTDATLDPDHTNANVGNAVEKWQSFSTKAEAVEWLRGKSLTVTIVGYFCDRFTKYPKAVIRFDV